MKHLQNQFRLDVRIENQPPLKIDVIDSITVGLDPRNDLVLVLRKIKNRHLVFHKKEENLALQYLGNTNQTFLNSLPLEEGRTYILEPGDSLTFAGAEIIIRHELIHVHETQNIKKILFDNASDLVPESAKDSIIYADNPTGSMKKEKHVRPNIVKEVVKVNHGKLLSLWMIKIYAIITDAFITYAIMVSVLPLVYVDKYLLGFLHYVTNLIIPGSTSSFFQFFVAWYILSFMQTMVLGTTFGQIALGLRFESNASFGKLILFRFKTFFYSLFMLPAQTKVLETFFFKAIRKAGIIFIFAFILMSPFLLPAPYNTPVISINNKNSSVKHDLRSRSVYSHSENLQLTLQTELSFRYYLLPSVVENATKRAFVFTDLESGRSIEIRETEVLSYDELEAQLQYGNPLYSLLHRTKLNELTLKEKKEIVENILSLSPIKFMSTTASFGPFFGSGILLKEKFLGGNSSSDITVKAYAPETPVISVSSSQQDFFYLFGKDGIHRFVIDAPSRGGMTAILEDSFFTKFTADSEGPEIKNTQVVTLLQALDAFLQGNEQSFLTYYIIEANSLSNVKILHAEMDLTETAKLALIKNIEAVQKFIKDKNVYKSFNDIKNQLAPMEKPGEKR